MRTRAKTRSVFFIVAMILLTIQCNQQTESDITKAVSFQLKLYPESTLLDIYKSFFQDEFGPGHLVENISYAREYFDLELEEMVSLGRREAEPCGTGKNFYRVPMDLVKDGIIPEEEYFAGFLESSSAFKIPDLNDWTKKWGEIVQEIDKMDLQISNLERDKKIIANLLSQGEPLVHHSNVFNSKYDPHYRIFSIVQWEKMKASSPQNLHPPRPGPVQVQDDVRAVFSLKSLVLSWGYNQ